MSPLGLRLSEELSRNRAWTKPADPRRFGGFKRRSGRDLFFGALRGEDDF